MKFDIFYQLPAAPEQAAPARYRELIEEAVEADRLGFDTVWLAEVHFAPRFSLMPAPLMLLAAIAERTQRLRLGMAVNLLPLHHPVRLAEEIAMLDAMSNGRVEFGAGRGAFPANYRGYNLDVESSRERFEEGLEVVRGAWTQQRLTFHGRFVNLDGVEVIPKPVQKPHPPIRLAANSVETFRFAGRNGYPIFAGGPVNPIPILAERLEIYREGLAEGGCAMPDDWLAAALFTFPGRGSDAVRAAIEPSLRNYFEVVAGMIEPQTLPSGSAADVEKVRGRMRAIEFSTVDSTMAVYGEPARCVAKIAELRARFKFDRLVCWFETGGLIGHRAVIDAMRLFAERVMPEFARK